MQNKNLLLSLVILVFALSLVGVYVFAAKLNPGHTWDQIGCDKDSSCNLIVDKDGNITSGINLKTGSLNVNIGIDTSGAYIKSGTTKVVGITSTHFEINQKVKIKGINNKAGEVQMSCTDGKCYAVYAE
jgi:hypothetical protein